MAQSLDDPEEKPLDPAVLRVQQRLRRLMLIAGLTLGLGMIAVFGAIIYRIAHMDASVPPAPLAAGGVVLSREAVGLGADAALVGTALDGARLALTYADGAGTTVIVVDIGTGAVVSRVRIGTH